MLRLLQLPQRLLDELRRRSWIQLLAALTVGSWIGWKTMSPSLDARWHLIDDHEIARFIGPTGNLSVGRYWYWLHNTEAGHPGGFSRYRPSYYAARLMESFLWGGHPSVWYGARMVFFGLMLASIVWVLRRHLSLFENAFLAVLVATFAFWNDIFARLGPSEAYGALGCALYAIGFDLAWKPSLTRRWALAAGALVWIGGGLAVGSKENFLFLLAPTAYLAWRMRERGPRRWVLASCLLLIAFGLFVGISAAVGVKLHGHVYRQDISAGGRLAVLWRALSQLFEAWKKYLFAAMVILGAAVGSLAMRQPRFTGLRKLLVDTGRCAGALAALAALLLSQHIFYNGRWPSAAGDGIPRYDFPGLLVTPLVIYVGCYWLLKVFEDVGLPRWPMAWVRLGVVAWLVMAGPPRTFPLEGAARQAVGETAAFGSKLELIQKAAKDNPKNAIVLESYNVYDFEPLMSVRRFLSMYRVNPPTFLKLHYSSAQFGPGSLERVLAADLEGIAKGENSGLPGTLRPWSSFAPPCYSIGFGGGGDSSGCTFLTGF